MRPSSVREVSCAQCSDATREALGLAETDLQFGSRYAAHPHGLLSLLSSVLSLTRPYKVEDWLPERSPLQI